MGVDKAVERRPVQEPAAEESQAKERTLGMSRLGSQGEEHSRTERIVREV